MRECLASTETAVLHSIIPHLGALDEIAPGNTPSLAKALCKLRSVDFADVPEAKTPELSFHAWLQENMNLGQVPLLHCSPLYNTFLQVSF